ncbi:MAG: isochorismatase family cysteine hydrolase [Patescibacteria group bacterium]|nr:isochorismatase family cysteine hydrolase [Patescibacteria group bacterium]
MVKKTKKAVVVIDMLYDFVYGALKNKRSEQIIEPLADLLEYARKMDWLVVYANDAHLPGDPEERVWGPHALAGTSGAEVIKELKPQKGDIVLPKRTYSAFNETGLDLLLRQHGVSTIIFTGQHTHICVRHSCADAFANNYKIIIPKDAVESLTQKDHDEGLKYLEMCYGAKITKTKYLKK